MSSGERCLKWFPLCFRSLFGKFVAALKTIICSDVSLIVLKVEKGIYSVGDTGGSEEKIQVLPVGVEPMTLLLLVQIELYH